VTGGASMQEFAIWESHLSGSKFISISKEQYENFGNARRCLSSIRGLEEKFLVVCESYRDFEIFNFDVNINDLIFNISFGHDMNNYIAGMNRKIMHVLTCTKLYLDSICRHYKAISGDKDCQFTNKLRNDAFDKFFEYRVMEAVRNFIQHESLPINSATFGSKKEKLGAPAIYYAEYKLDTSNLDKNNGFKKEIITEINKQGGILNLKNALRLYFSHICEIHSSIRKKIFDRRANAENRISDAQKMWLDTFSDYRKDLLSVKIGAFSNGKENKNFKSYSVSTQIDEYRRYIEMRTGFIGNMSRRQVGW
jgi:hypothetical protein